MADVSGMKENTFPYSTLSLSFDSDSNEVCYSMKRHKGFVMGNCLKEI